MAVSLNSVVVGKCFVTSAGEIRRVMEMPAGNVKFATRGKNERSGSWTNWTTVGVEKFAIDVDHEVTCD